MERLTTRSILGGWTLKVPRQEAVDRLAAYEDTGMEPEEIKAVSKALDGIPFGRFREIVEAERDGRLVVLPCKVGTPVYVLRGDVNNGWETTKKTHIETVPGGFSIGMLNRITMEMYDFYYLTREAAKAALKAGEPQ